MNISRKWLERHVDLADKSSAEILNDLTMSTAEVEGVTSFGSELATLVIGHVVECGRHPDADKLSVTKVDVGQGELQQIVCGAPNVAKGQNVCVILPGNRLPDGTKIKKSKIRGVESRGMICSESELGLSEDHDGIMVFDEGLAPGTSFLDATGLADDVFEIDNKSINHRPDLWGHYGIARELAAIYGRELRPLGGPDGLAVELPTRGDTLPVDIEDLVACPRYTGLVIQGVAAGPSPAWLRNLLTAVGQRPINLLVDLTNFVMLELGQPMHAFDLRRLDGAKIGVRNARAGESIRTLDAVDRKLVEQDLLITANDEPVALAGIMGGEGTMVEDDTTALFLESANFKASVVRATSTRLGLRTDASARFEKTLDPSTAELASRYFLHLVGQLCPGAKAAGPLVDPAAWSFEPRSIPLRRARLDLKLGVVIDDARVTDILTRLAFEVTKTSDGFDVGVPSFRATKDITIEDDLIEEVGRMFRYDNIPEQPLVSTVVVPPREPELYLARTAARLVATEVGAHEVYNYSFAHDAVLDACLAGDHAYAVVSNPVAPETARMRRHVLPSVLGNLSRNLERSADVRLFELGKGYDPSERDEHGLPHEVHELAIVRAVRDGASPYAELRTQVDSVLRRLGFPAVLEEAFADDVQPWVHPGRSVALARDGRRVGYVGTLHPQVARNLRLPSSSQTAIATIDLRRLLASGRRETEFAKISPYPTQPVDVALLVPRSARVGDLAKFLRAAGPKVVTDVELFEVYIGDGIPDDQKSLNFTVTLGSMDRTLTAKDEEKYLNRVRQTAADVGAELRG